MIKSKSFLWVGIAMAAYLCVLTTHPAMAAKAWKGSKITNSEGKDVNDLKITFSGKVRSVKSNKFNTAKADGGSPSTAWTLSGGSVSDGQKAKVKWESGSETSEKIDSAQWTIKGVSQGYIDANDIDGNSNVKKYSSQEGPSGAGFTEPRLVISNVDPIVRLRFDDFQAWISNDPNGVDEGNFHTPTGSPVAGLPSTIVLDPGQEFDTGYLPEMAKTTYVLFTATLTEEGPGGESMEWAYGHYELFFCTWKIPGDINEDCSVDFLDLAELANSWLESSLQP